MVSNLLVTELDHLRSRWGWLLALGILMVVIGVIALYYTPHATVGTVLVFGWLLIISGVIETVHAFRVRKWGGMAMHLLGGILGVLIGMLVVTHPVVGALALTLLFAAFFTVMGVFRIITAISMRFPNWGWAVFDGIVTLALGVLVWAQWPSSGLWFIGMAVGISLILRGWTDIMMAMTVHSLKLPVEVRRAA